jgi:hypothetical protein
MQNEPNFRRGDREHVCKTKPISGRGQKMASAWWGRNYGELVTQAATAKQSQFRAAGCVPRGIVQNEANFAPMPGNGRGLVGRDAPPECDCAKRTQFSEFQVSSRKSQTSSPLTSNLTLSCVQNEPNLAGRDGLPSSLGPPASPPPSRLCKTNPISGGAGWDEGPGAWDTGQSCKTNPISAG